ncbi:ABC transporter permease [Leucothrix pacifica]|uniref:ABC transporter permease n=2 Tax=Leucothrix pacifica TaxID=1247513 RepID=A0A317C561_9GAMM|nr:ABC transporter permease [Leucothrix pacifica]
MLSMIIRRIGQSILVLLIVALVAFSMFRFVGDPVSVMLGQEATETDREMLRERLGLNNSLLVQYGRFVGRALEGDFGVSYRTGESVAAMIADRAPATIELALFSGILATIFGITFGVITAINRKGFFSQFIMTTSLIGVSLPTFLIGVLLIWLFSVELGWLPSFGRSGVTQLGSWWHTSILTLEGIKSLILPAITLGLYQMTLIMRLVRAEMLEVLGQDYIRFARARGLPLRSIYFDHALKNTLVPVITIIGLQFGSIIAFSIITESVFQWPGLGLMFINAIYHVDIPVMSAYLVMVSIIFVAINLIVDILYLFIDPRIRDAANAGASE